MGDLALGPAGQAQGSMTLGGAEPNQETDIHERFARVPDAQTHLLLRAARDRAPVRARERPLSKVDAERKSDARPGQRADGPAREQAAARRRQRPQTMGVPTEGHNGGIGPRLDKSGKGGALCNGTGCIGGLSVRG
jgi:hypothetical protein